MKAVRRWFIGSPRPLTSILRAALSGRRVPVLPGLSGLIVAGGYDRSAGVARSAGVSSAGGFLGSGWTAAGRLCEGGSESLPSLGDGGGPPPGGVDPKSDLSGAAGDAGGDVQH